MMILRIGILVILSVVEIGLIASGGRYPLPRRETELRALRAYMQDTADTGKQKAWADERRRTERELMISRTVVYALAVLNGALIIVVIRRIRQGKRGLSIQSRNGMG